ncbi:uncharacterized protein TNCV_784451 [Trichonephila clavipes]|nr:uncharacterized protein TNCV_784451 [Trichonephila clavipes]
MEEKERQRQYEMEEKERQRQYELQLARIQAQSHLVEVNENLPLSENNTKRKFHLPKLEFRKFSGNIKDWLPFWSQLEHIHKDGEIASGKKFRNLIQATVSGSRAREIVESFLPTSANYAKAVERLKARFGRNDLLVEVYVRELLKLVISVHKNEKFSMTSLYDKLESHMRALETLEVTTDKCASILYPMVES